MEIAIVWFVLSAVAGVIADRKGRSGGWAFLLSIVATPIVGIVVAVSLKPSQKRLDAAALKNGMKKCPACAELVKAEAIKCKHCGTAIDA